MTLSLNSQILIAALSGIALGIGFNLLGANHTITQQGMFLCSLTAGVFIDMLKMILAPLVFASIAVGIANLREHQQIHCVWQITLGFFAVSMALAIVLGLTSANWLEPGKGLHLSMFDHALSGYQAQALKPSEFLLKFSHSLFMNPIAALAQGNVLAIVVFALLLGIALVIGGERYKNLLFLLKELQELMLLLVSWIMRLAPIGILALLAQLAANQEHELLMSLGQFIALVITTTLIHGFIVLPLLLWLVTRVTPKHFFRHTREALITAFATSSSSATLPVSLRCAQQHLHVKSDIAGFVIPLGATINMDGTALYEATAALFVANLTGVELDFSQQLIVFITAMIAAMGAPGIPSAGMVTMVMVLQSVGLPAEAIAILLPIDRLLDTVRTMVNVEGDLVGSLVVQKLVYRKAPNHS